MKSTTPIISARKAGVVTPAGVCKAGMLKNKISTHRLCNLLTSEKIRGAFQVEKTSHWFLKNPESIKVLNLRKRKKRTVNPEKITGKGSPNPVIPAKDAPWLTPTAAVKAGLIEFTRETVCRILKNKKVPGAFQEKETKRWIMKNPESIEYFQEYKTK